MTLTAIAARNAKPREKPYKLAAGSGIYLEVMPTGARYWRMKYRYGGKEKRLAFGVFPEVSLADAREAAEKARAQLTAITTCCKGCSPSDVARRQPASALVNRAIGTLLHWKPLTSSALPCHRARTCFRPGFPIKGYAWRTAREASERPCGNWVSL